MSHLDLFQALCPYNFTSKPRDFSSSEGQVRTYFHFIIEGGALEKLLNTKLGINRTVLKVVHWYNLPIVTETAKSVYTNTTFSWLSCKVRDLK